MKNDLVFVRVCYLYSYYFQFNPKNGDDRHSHDGNVSSTTAFPITEKCCPVLIEKSSPQSVGGDNQRIVCGSWSSDVTAPIFGGDSDVYASVKEKIEDAMRDTASMTSSSGSSDQVYIFCLFSKLVRGLVICIRKNMCLSNSIFFKF